MLIDHFVRFKRTIFGLAVHSRSSWPFSPLVEMAVYLEWECFLDWSFIWSGYLCLVFQANQSATVNSIILNNVFLIKLTYDKFLGYLHRNTSKLFLLGIQKYCMIHPRNGRLSQIVGSFHSQQSYSPNKI